MPYKLFLQFILPGNIQKWPLKSDVLTKNPLLFPELPIYLSLFSRCTILFPEISLLFSRSTFLFSRCAFSFLRLTLLFSSIWLQFSRSAFFLFTVHVFFQEWFFPADCALSLSGSQLLRDIMFALLLFYFLLELFADQLMMPSWKP